MGPFHCVVVWMGRMNHVFEGKSVKKENARLPNDLVTTFGNEG